VINLGIQYSQTNINIFVIQHCLMLVFPFLLHSCPFLSFCFHHILLPILFRIYVWINLFYPCVILSTYFKCDCILNKYFFVNLWPLVLCNLPFLLIFSTSTPTFFDVFSVCKFVPYVFIYLLFSIVYFSCVCLIFCVLNL